MSDNNLKYLTVYDVRKITRMSIDSIRKNIRDGKLRASKVGTRYLISEKDLLDFIELKTNVSNNVSK